MARDRDNVRSSVSSNHRAAPRGERTTGHRGRDLHDRLGNRGMLRAAKLGRDPDRASDSRSANHEREADRAGDRLALDPVVTEMPRGNVAPLSPSMRAHLEPEIGCDLSHVRLHDDADAHARASQLGARAFTIGRDVYFARGQLAPETPDGRSLLGHELAHVGQQARDASTGIQCKEFAGKKPLLIDEEITNSVWVGYVRSTAAKMNLSPDDPRVRAEADRLTAIQIGPTNFQRFKEYAQPERLHIDPVKGNEMYERMEREREEEEAKPTLLPNGQPYTAQNARAFTYEEGERLYQRVLRLSKDVGTMEPHVIKLATPGGVTGALYKYGAGITGMVVAPTAGTLSKVASLPVQKVFSAVTGTPDNTTLGTIADEQVSDAITAYQLTAGDLHAIYLDTRTSYNAFMAAVSEATDGIVALRNATGMREENEAFAKIQAAQRKAAEAYAVYAIACELAGVKAKARNLVRMVDNTAEGVVFTLETVATLPLGGAAKAGRQVLKQGEEALEDVAKQAPKVLDDVATKAPKKPPKVSKPKPPKPMSPDDVAPVRSRPGADPDVLEAPIQKRSPTARPAAKDPFYSKRGNRVPMGKPGKVTVPKPGGDPPKEWVAQLGKKEAQNAMDEYSKVADLPGSENWVEDLATSNQRDVVVGSRGEMRVAARLQELDVPIEKVADKVDSKKAGDILTPGRVIDVKTLTIDEAYLKRPDFINNRQIDEYVEQVAKHMKRYPGRKVVYIFEGVTKQGIPPNMIKRLEDAGVDVRGALDDLSDLATPP